MHKVMKLMGFYDVCHINGKSRGKIRHWWFRGNGLHGNIFQRHGSDNDWRVIMMDEGGVEVDGKSDEAMLQVYMWNRCWQGWTMIICVIPSNVPSALFKTHPPIVSGTISKASQAMAGLLYIYIVTYSWGWGPVPWIYCTDIFPDRYQYAIRKDTLKPARNGLLADGL